MSSSCAARSRTSRCPRNSVDVIISNCVVNLSPDKDAVLREAYRVLKPGGRVAISDVVIRDADPGEPEIPEAVRRDVGLWTGCIAGALEAREYREKLAAAGFTNIEVQEIKRYAADETLRLRLLRTCRDGRCRDR